MNAIERIGWALVEHSSISFRDFFLIFIFAFMLGLFFMLGQSVAISIRNKYEARKREKRRQAIRARAR